MNCYKSLCQILSNNISDEMIPRLIVNVNDYYDNDCARFHTIKIENLKIIGDLMAIMCITDDNSRLEHLSIIIHLRFRECKCYFSVKTNTISFMLAL